MQIQGCDQLLDKTLKIRTYSRCMFDSMVHPNCSDTVDPLEVGMHQQLEMTAHHFVPTPQRCQWLLEEHSSPRRVFTRPMGALELGFFLDGELNGADDIIQHAEVQTTSSPELLNENNVRRAWVSLKQRFPLLGSSAHTNDEGETAYFLVDEARLSNVTSVEINHREVDSLEAIEALVQELLNGPGQLSSSMPACLHVLRQTDQKDRFHILLHMAHHITDGLANAVALKTFLNILASPPTNSIPDLETRLAMVIAAENLNPTVKLNIQQQRWRRAIAFVLSDIKLRKMKGGITLSPKIAPIASGDYTPAQSCMVSVSLAEETSTAIILACRRNKVTFGNVFPVCAQVAFARLLHRQYARGEISRERWEHVRREPYHVCGPLNIRPYLDHEWFRNGGAEEVCLSIGFFYHTLPPVPLGDIDPMRMGFGRESPAFDELLSRERFFLRANMVKSQLMVMLKDPLFLDIHTARMHTRRDRKRVVFRKQQRNRTGPVGPAAAKKDVSSMSPALVFAHGGSSMGNMDRVLPLQYPIITGKSKVLPQECCNTDDEAQDTCSPALILLSSDLRIRCRPAELYLGASMSNKKLHLKFFWDENVYEGSAVREWLGEIRDAVVWYLSAA